MENKRLTRLNSELLMGSAQCCGNRPLLELSSNSPKRGSFRGTFESQASTQAPFSPLLQSPQSSSADELSDEDFILLNIKNASIAELVENLPSCVPVNIKLKDTAWVSPPKSVGALSCLRLAEVLARTTELDRKTIHAIHEGLGVEKVLINLGSVHRDKREAAGLALEQISICREPLFLSKLLSDRSLLVLAIRLTEDVEEFRVCISNVIYNIYKGNLRVKQHIAEFQSGRIIRAMVQILQEFTDFDLMFLHAARIREFYFDKDNRVDRSLLQTLLTHDFKLVIARISQAIASLDEPLSIYKLKCLLEDMAEESALTVYQ